MVFNFWYPVIDVIELLIMAIAMFQSDGYQQNRMMNTDFIVSILLMQGIIIMQ